VSGETEDSVSGWTVDTLNSHLNRMLVERDTRVEQRFKETDAAHEGLRKEIHAESKVINTRLKGMDKATDLLYQNVNRVPTDVDRQVGTLERIIDGKLNGLKELTNQRFADNQTAVNKQETATTKEIDALRINIDSKAKASDDKIDDLKESRSRLGGAVGAIDKAWVILAGLIGIAVALYAALHH